MKNKILAEIIFPPHLEGGRAFVGACIMDGSKVKAGQRKRLVDALPPEADVLYHGNKMRIELELPAHGRTKRAIAAAVRTLSSAIRKSLNINAGRCPVASSRQVLLVTRSG